MSEVTESSVDTDKVQAEPEQVDYKAQAEKFQALNKELIEQRKQRQERTKALQEKVDAFEAKSKTESNVAPDPEVLTLKARLQALEQTDAKRTERLEGKYQTLLAKLPPEVLELQKPILEQANTMSVDNRIDWLEKVIPAMYGNKARQDVPVHKPVASEKSSPTLSDEEWGLARKHGHSKEMAISFKLDDPNFYKQQK